MLGTLVNELAKTRASQELACHGRPAVGVPSLRFCDRGGRRRIRQCRMLLHASAARCAGNMAACSCCSPITELEASHLDGRVRGATLTRSLGGHDRPRPQQPEARFRAKCAELPVAQVGRAWLRLDPRPARRWPSPPGDLQHRATTCQRARARCQWRVRATPGPVAARPKSAALSALKLSGSTPGGPRPGLPVAPRRGDS